MQQEAQELKPAAIAALLLLSLLGGPALAAPIEGQWKIDARDHGDEVELSLKRSWDRDGSRGTWSHTSDFDRKALRGLPAGQSVDGPVTIAIVRESGTIRLDGTMDDGLGRGRFTFEADPGFAAELKRAGFQDVNDEELLRVCLHDLDRAWFKDVRSLGLRDVTLEGLLRLSTHDVSPQFVRGLAAAGYSSLDVEEVVRLKVHGVTPAYVQGLGAKPERRPTVEEIVRFKIHGLEPSYVSALSRHFDPEEMVRLHLHGVSADYVREFRALGYESASADDLVRLRNHGVSSAFARRAVSLHGRVTTDELIRLKINGVE